jgi:CBS domain containing-hemolysin-like protein
MRISEIFELYGEATFRDYETEIVRRVLRLDEVVVPDLVVTVDDAATAAAPSGQGISGAMPSA